MSKQVQVHGALFLVALIYGSNYSIAKEVMPFYVGPFGLIVIRVVSAALFFGIFSRLVVKEKIVGWADNVRSILCGITGIAINQLCFFAGLNLTAPINAALLMVIVPVIVLLFSAILLRERVGWRKVAGIAVACTGAMLLIYSSRSESTTGNLFGDLLIILNATSFGIYLVIVKPLMQKYNAFTIVSRIFAVGAVLVIPFGWTQVLTPDYSSFPVSIWLAILFMIFAVTIITYLFNTWALRYANPSLVGAYIYLQPILAVFIAVGLGSDVFTLQKGLYALLIFAGVYLVSRTRQQVGSPE
ncbi:drug/metabolite transporter (DMT)-like permease [Pontibacter ummariensis]|uniref:Permease of the drug/metabolite transporter (DMT) superfamily n=1 Tax=Pontibacter ummariensis TaxID=1610492 RepID=A0A239D6H2_9BACT|nr:DMT family transporter [Pontibacter ummariensis]PRY14276.1 drug/metabolite transporter (DMT)-like permease [Pontibacter ummariensis]SNS27985.1 Permease of the drug/metabolite transporter (DMT) superfamily [Pontibacter ummariensis]